MPYYFEMEPQRRVVRVVLEGRVDDAEMLEIYRLIGVRYKALRPAGGIVDFSAVTDFSVSGATIRRMAEERPPFPPNVPRYLVAPLDYMFGMARMFQLLGEETRPGLQVVRTREEAYRGLAIANPAFERLE